MALAVLPALLRATTVREAVRVVRSSPGDDRTKKQMLNEWFNLREFEESLRIARREAVQLLYGEDVTAHPGRRQLLSQRSQLDQDILSEILKIRRNGRRLAFELIFGTARLARLGG